MYTSSEKLMIDPALLVIDKSHFITAMQRIVPAGLRGLLNTFNFGEVICFLSPSYLLLLNS